MAYTLVKTVPDFQTTLASKVSVGATTATLTTATDDDGVALASGTYAFTIDRKNSNKEYIECTLNGTSLTNIKTIARGTGQSTAGFAKSHRKGAEVIISDFAIIKRLTDLLDGTTNLDSTNPLEYDGTPSLTTPNQIATKDYVDSVAIAGGADASTTIKGISKLSVAPASPTDPIAVGTNDPRIPSQTENDALVGTSGTPSTSNRYVTNADTSGSGAVVRNSLLSNFVSAKETFTAAAAITAGQALHYTRFGVSDGGIIFDNAKTTQYASATNPTDTFVVGSGSNRVLIVGVYATGSVTNVTYNGVAMTLVDSQAQAGHTISVYRLVAPSTGSNTIAVTGSGVNIIGSSSFFNVSQASPMANSAKSAGAATYGQPLTLNQTINVGMQLVYAVGSAGSGSFLSPNMTAAARFSAAAPYTNYSIGGSGVSMILGYLSVEESANMTITPTWSWSGGGTPNAATIGLVLQPAGTQITGVVPTNATTATVNFPRIDFVGFADASVAAGASVSVTVAGIASGLSGLTAGRKYYLQNTNGTLSTSQSGGYGKVVGVALSATTLLIAPEKTNSNGAITKTSNYTFTAECDGTAYVENNSSGTTATIITGGSTYTAQINAASTTMPLAVPVARGSTYAFNNAGNNHRFIPEA